MKSRLLVLLLVPLWLWPALVIADEVQGEQYVDAAWPAYQRGDWEGDGCRLAREARMPGPTGKFRLR